MVSNHGGRQLDRSPTPLELVAAVALGASACLVGRAYLYGLMAAGEQDVDRVAETFADEVRRALQMAALFPEVRSVEHLYARLEVPLYGDLVVPGPHGRFEIPTGPGLGADLDPEVLARYRVA